MEAAAEAGQAEAEAAAAGQAEDRAVVDALGAVLFAGARSAPSAWSTLSTSTTRKSTRFDGSFPSGPRSNPAGAPVSARNTSVPFGWPYSGPDRSLWCLSWPTMLTRAASAAEQGPPPSGDRHSAAPALRHAAGALLSYTPGPSRLDNAIPLAPMVRLYR